MTRGSGLAAPLLAVLVAVALCGCQATGETRLQDLQAGQRPALESDEAGLWMVADRSERAVLESGRVVRDPVLQAYVKGIVCRLAPEHCAQVRIHVIRTPSFNATMSPNGYMQVWTGLVLRAENEDQLAYVLGHELGHFLRRHSVQRWRAIRATTDATSFFQVLTAAAGVPVVGQVGQIAALGGLMAYSRDHEREADDAGLLLMAQAGYDPREAPRIWEALLAEREAEDKDEPSIFFATHPSPAERIAALRERAAAAPPPARAARADGPGHDHILALHRRAWLGDELRNRKHAASLVLLERLGRDRDAAGDVAFHRGEVYRLRGEDGDDVRAASAYREAIAAGGAPVEAHRSLGLVLWRSGDTAQARDAFKAYLTGAPDADDRAMVASYLVTLGD